MSTAAREEIAIIGIGCRFPGGADAPERFWQVLRDGVDAITEVPPDRPQLMEVYDPDPSKPGRSYLRRGGFVRGVDEWDAAFFGISPREAQHIDPQHRLLLEVAWEAMEDAGHDPERLAGSRTGVFVGISTHDYGDTTCDPANRALLDSHSNSGSATSIAANRISYLYDLRGPSMTIDTACSSSLTAAHLACASLLAGECEQAIVGGVQLQLNPELTIGFCKAGMISPDGECRAFDASANGYVRSEGAGAVMLKPLRAALADGDRIYAVIAGSAVNQDGRTTGMTVPSRIAQEALLREALASAGLAPADVHYLEAHGTGTPVGDPIEAGALGAVLREGRSAPCPIGSVKTNIGHLEAGSGIAGLIKATLCVHHRRIPPSLHYRAPNPALDLEGGCLRVVTALEEWPSAARATAGVNSFGFGGANAHAIVREAPRVMPRVSEAPPADEATLLPIGARSDAALDALARRYIDLLSRSDAPTLADVATTAAHRRAQHDHRIAVVAGARDDAIDALDAAVAGETRTALARGRTGDAGKLAFVYSGMGPQWWGMGQQLGATNRVFREMLERCHEALLPHAPWKLLDELARDEATSRVSEPDLAQVTNFAIQVAVAEVLRSWGIVPDAVVGHSAGEMAAAYASGALSLDDAVKVAYHRSRLQAEALPGKILAIGLPAAEIEHRIAEYGGELEVAAVNSPLSCTVAGGTAAIESLHARLQAEQIFVRVLGFAVPYHSAKMDPIRAALTGVLSDVRARSGTIPMYSTAFGDWIDGARLGGDYWFENVRRTVRFADGVEALFESGHRTLVEISPHPVLTGSIAECLGARKARATVLGTLRRKEDERASLLRSAAQLWVQGRALDWDGVHAGRRGNVPLPTYPWQRERHWLATADGRAAPEPSVGENAASQHPLLGRRVRAPQPLWESSLGGDRLAYLDDHLIQGAVVFPGAAYLEMALAAARAMRDAGTAPLRVQRVAFRRALFVPDRARSVVQFVVDASSGHFEVHSTAATSAEAVWTLHADGEIATGPIEEPPRVDRGAVLARCRAERPHDECYDALARRGLEYGPAFRGIARVWTGTDEAIGWIEVPDAPVQARLDAEPYALHPALLDAALQLLICAGGWGDGAEGRGGVFLPVALRELTAYAAGAAAFWAHARLTTHDDDTVEGDISLADESGRVIAALRGLRCQRVADARSREGIDDWLYELRWEPRALSSAASAIAIEPAELAAGWCIEADRASAARHWGDYYAQLEHRLDDLAAAWMVCALRELAARAGDPGAFTLALLGITPSQHAMAGHMLAALERRGVVVRRGDGWSPRWGELPASDPIALGTAIAAEHPAYGVVVELVARSGARLADVLRGAADAATVLFGVDDGALVSRFYREAPPSSLYNDLVARLLSDAARSAEPGRRVRFLEIGGGTGGTTAAVLPLLDPARSEYVFTDVSPRFIDAAKATFGSSSFSARLFDVERDAAGQGVERGSFDVVLAANVLHATRSLAESVANARSLLAPGGVLVLLEITRGPLWIDLVFGLTDGWWRFADRSLRPSHPLVAAAQWASVLEASGFDAIAAVRDTSPGGEAAQTVMVARAAAAVPRAPGLEAGDWIVLADHGGVGETLASRLTSLGAGTVIVSPGDAFAELGDRHFTMPVADASAVGMLLATLDERGVRPRGVVSCVALDASDDGGELLAAQRAGVGGAMAVVQALAARGSSTASPSLCLVTAGAQPMGDTPRPLAVAQAPLWGFGRVVSKEHPALHTRLVDLSSTPTDDELASLARELASGEWEDELALRGGERWVRRLHRVPSSDLAEPRRALPVDGGYRVEIDTAGALETLGLRQCERRAPTAGEVEVAVQAAALNFRDVMIAMGLQPNHDGEPTFGRDLLGLDFAGVVTAVGDGVTALAVGDEVAGIGPGTFASHVTTPAAVVARRPQGLALAEAAGIPSVFVTAHYSLRHLARLRAGERVLIHAATGGVGLAALQVARDVGAEVFATAGSSEKRTLLASLGVTHVMDSRTLAWADDVMERTHGEGVDVVLNSLAGEAIPRGIGVLRPYGRFIEIGKRDIYQDRRIGLLAFRQNLAFFGVDVDLLSLQRPDVAHEMLLEVVDRFERGVYAPLPSQEFPLARVEDAMRVMQQAKHIGKIVLRFDDPPATLRPARDATLFRPDASYLVTGGLGGFGLAVVGWMRREGAGAVVLMGRSAPSAEAEAHIALLRRDGMRVEVVRGDVTRRDDVRRAIAAADALQPLRGIVHAAMVLDDAPIAELDLARIDAVMGPKAAGAWNLHTESLDRTLDCFVMFSSLTATFGNPLQANYAAANAYLDALAHHRRAAGLHALAVNWGPLAQVGYVSRHRDVGQYLERQGYDALTPEQAFQVLGTLLRRDATHLTAARIDWPRWATSAPAAASSAMLREFAPTRAAGDSRGGESASLRGELIALPEAERRQRALAFLRERVGKVLGISPAKIADDRPLTTIGFDSLIAVELLTVLHMQLGVELPAVKILQGATLDGLASLVLEELGADAGAGAPIVVAPSLDGPPVVPVASAAPAAPPAANGNGGGNGHHGELAVVAPEPTKPARIHTPPTEPATLTVTSVTSMPLPRARRASRSTPEFYEALDYSRWGTAQRVVRGLVGAGVRAVARVSVEGLEHLPATGGCILAINHLSMADVPVVLSLLPRRTIMLASDHLRHSRVMDWFLSDLGDAIYVRRGDGDLDALQRGLAVLRAGGLLGLGPEGTRSRDGGLGPGRTGIAYLAARAQVPIVPLAAWGQERMPPHWRSFRRAPVTVRVGTPLRLDGDATPREQTDVVMRAIAALLPGEYRGVYADGAP